MLPAIIGLLGRAVIPTALTAIGINNVDVVAPAVQPEAIPLTGDPVVDGLAILAVVVRMAYVKVKKKRAKEPPAPK